MSVLARAMLALGVLLVATIVMTGTIVCAQQSSIVNSPHNLSVRGPGAIRATSEQEVCIFCHTPHNAAPVQPLWNRATPANAYTIYSSSSLQAKPGQPTGSSKLCLSCHDGTIAVGSVLSRNQPISMAGGVTTLPPGESNVGTDLSDDHPVSFLYDATLAGQDPQIRPPSALPSDIKLDGNSEMQCTSCHDAHDNEFGKFLVMDNASSQLCNSCHQISDTRISAHVECASCHKMHSAPSGPMLLSGVNSSETCLKCHSSQKSLTQGADIEQDMNKLSRHHFPPERAHSDAEAFGATNQNVTCSGCHEPHTMQTGTAAAPQLSPKLGKISGVTVAGAPIEVANYNYEVCFKCHADTAKPSAVLTRQIAQVNTRLEFSSTAVSYHPVIIAGKNTNVPSLRQGLTSASMIYCVDCHSSDAGSAVSGSTGPHGSNNPPLLIARYDTTDNTPESTQAYALCYRCHDRTSILNNESFSSHSLHIVNETTPCSICHDAHGISSAQGTTTNNAHLINFDTSVVRPDPVTGKLQYVSLGMGSGQCFLSCHGAAHSPLAYPGQGPLQPGPLRRQIAPPARISSPAPPRGAAPQRDRRTR
jgi:predicted CXXCH cytochrome family protein